MRLRLLLGLVMSLVAAARVDAQGIDGQLNGGEIVRFHLYGESSSGLRVGRINRLTADSVILETCFRCDPLRYSRHEIADLEVYRGSSYGRNAVLGFLGGALFSGGVAALIVGSQSCHDDLCGLRYIAVPFATLAGGLVGLFIGLGLAKQTWETVPNP